MLLHPTILCLYQNMLFQLTKNQNLLINTIYIVKLGILPVI